MPTMRDREGCARRRSSAPAVRAHMLGEGVHGARPWGDGLRGHEAVGASRGGRDGDADEHVDAVHKLARHRAQRGGLRDLRAQRRDVLAGAHVAGAGIGASARRPARLRRRERRRDEDCELVQHRAGRGARRVLDESMCTPSKSPPTGYFAIRRDRRNLL
eukprot:4958529-Prymnesium_polylepis.1